MVCFRSSFLLYIFLKNGLNLRFIELLMYNGRSLFNRLICIILLSRQQNHKKFEIPTATEINKCKMV